MNSISEIYKSMKKTLRDECEGMVRSGDMDQDSADFRYYMVQDELLSAIINEEE